MKIKLSENVALNPELIGKLLQLQTADEARKQKLANYYVADQAINHRLMKDVSKPNNKTAHPYGNYITDSITGYFMGQPIRYAASEPEFEDFAANLAEILEYNDEQSNNIELTKDTCKFGVGYELLWMDEAADIRFKRVDALNAFPIYDNTLEEDIIYFVRHYADNVLDTSSRTIEIYSKYEVHYYSKNNEQISYVSSTEHNWGMVPVAVYINNAEELGDYELVMSLIDGYDKLTSDSLNDFEAFVDAYLILKGMDGIDADDVSKMKENRILLLPNDGDAEWLSKAINDTYFQNVVKTLDSDIHKFSKVPDMMISNFHLPYSTLLMMVSAFAGYDLLFDAYKTAVKEKYRFGTYGDAMLII